MSGKKKAKRKNITKGSHDDADPLRIALEFKAAFGAAVAAGDLAEAERVRNRTVEGLENCLKGDGLSAELRIYATRELAIVFSESAQLLLNIQNPEAALGELSKALELLDSPAAAREKSDPLSMNDLVVCHGRCAFAHWDLGEHENAIRSARAALNLRERMAEIDVDNALSHRDLAIAWFILGEILESAGRQPEAKAAIKAAMKSFKNGAALDSKGSDIDWRSHIASSKEKLSSLG